MTGPLPPLRVGPFRLSVYGALASIGVVAAMALTARGARKSAVDPEIAWNAGLFAVVSCFLASRLLLVLEDPKAFLRSPLQVLSLPSLTFGGMALAALAVFISLRRQHQPLLPLLDAFAPGAALLAAFLEVGNLLQGSEPGMPVFGPGAEQVVAVRPVSLYGIGMASVLALLLWASLGNLPRWGQTAALGLLLGGAAALGLAMLSLPTEPIGSSPLEAGEWIALAAMLAGALLWSFAPLRSPAPEAAAASSELS